MNNFRLSTLLLFLPLFSQAQKLSQNVLNSAGSTFSSGNTTIQFSVGEAVTSSFANNSTLLSQGFNQPIKSDLPTSLRYLSDLDGSFSVFPSPTTEGVTLEMSDKAIVLTKIEVYAADGRLVLSQTDAKNFVNLSSLADGVYWLCPMATNKQFSLKKIVKIKN